MGTLNLPTRGVYLIFMFISVFAFKFIMSLFFSVSFAACTVALSAGNDFRYPDLDNNQDERK